MWQEKALARRLVAGLTARGVAAQAEGAGVHWHVTVAPVNGRSLQVNCFWYRRGLSGLLLGMNSANARSQLRPPPTAAYAGPEFEVMLEDGGTRIAEGRTRVMREAIACVRAWVAGASLDAVVADTPFVDEDRRELRAVAGRLDPRIHSEIDGSELWAYGDRRACKIGGESCRFFIGQAAVAFAPNSGDLPGDVAAWLLDGVSPANLARRGVLLERHADVLEADPARWHWLHVRDRMANPRDALAALAPLIAVLANSPIVSRFYTFSSLHRLCFSASSHYPWVGRYPVVSSDDGANYYLEYPKGAEGDDQGLSAACSLEETVARIETALAASPIEPFFGSEPDLEIRLVAESLNRLGSTLTAELVRRGMSSDVWLRRPPRRCRIDGSFLDCFGEGRRVDLRCGTRDEAVALALRFLDGSITLDALDADPRMIPPFDIRQLLSPAAAPE